MPTFTVEADIGGFDIEAAAPSLPMLFDACGMALAELASADDAGAPASSWEHVDLTAPDLAGLACAWFNELMRDAGYHRAELVDVAVDTVTSPPDGNGECWRLQGRVGLRWLFGHRGPARHDLRTATECLSVEVADGRWRLRAHLEPVDASSTLDDDQRAEAGDAPQSTRLLYPSAHFENRVGAGNWRTSAHDLA